MNFSAAKQSMTALEKSIESILWSAGASQVYFINDFGGNFKIIPTAKALLLNITDNTFSDIIFNSPVGEVAYELAYAEPGSTGLFLKGDSRVIVSSSTSTMTQLRMITGETAQEITLTYRPLASSTVTGYNSGNPINTVRVYVISMNASQNLTFASGFYLKARSVSVTSTFRSYNLSYALSSLQVKAVFDGVNGVVSLPVSNNRVNTLIEVEVLVCNIQLQKVGV